MRVLVWFRQDLRIADNPAFLAACKQGEVIPVYLYAPHEADPWALGGASRWWLHEALLDLCKILKGKGISLCVRKGESSASMLRDLIQETGAQAVYWNDGYEPHAVRRDLRIQSELKSQGIDVQCFNGSLLANPSTLLNKTGKPYRVFTPFWRTLQKHPMRNQVKAPGAIRASSIQPTSLKVEDLGLMPKHAWIHSVASAWQPTRDGGLALMRSFLKHHLRDYTDRRDGLAESGVSRLSPYLHWGQISPVELWEAAGGLGNLVAHPFLRQLAWREFAYHLLKHFETIPECPLQADFEHFPWEERPNELKAWQRGLTGYPVVDAGMRELWQSGSMHNRARMVVASFLVKDLRISWLCGARWFWDTLVDADLANNTLGWQWAGGCGADAAPYFRIFNPMIQGQKFDPDGVYVRRYCPELAKLPTRYIHAPWTAPKAVLNEACVCLGKDYPEPIVDHAVERQRALAAFEKWKHLRTPTQR